MITPADLEDLKANNPGKSFIYVFHTTKDGMFRGKNTYQHDVDVVIEVKPCVKVRVKMRVRRVCLVVVLSGFRCALP